MWPGGGPDRGAVAPGAGRVRGLAGGGGEGVSDTSGARRDFLRRGSALLRFAAAADGRPHRDLPGGSRAPGLAGRPRRDRDAARPLRGGALPGAHGRRGERRGDPGDRAAAGLQLRLHARRLHLPHHRLLLHLLAASCIARCSRCASQGKSAQQVLDAFVAEVRREGADGAQAEGLQSWPAIWFPAPAITAAGAALVLLISAAAGGGGRRRRRVPAAPLEASPEEMERLRQALAEVED